MFKNFFVLFFAIFLSQVALAFNAPKFNQADFKKAQKNGETILVDVYADWCPTCKKQHADLDELMKNDEMKSIVSFQVDYDDKELVKKFSNQIGKPIPRQSTIVVFKGEKLVLFSVADTGEKLKEKIKQGLK